MVAEVLPSDAFRISTPTQFAEGDFLSDPAGDVIHDISSGRDRLLMIQHLEEPAGTRDEGARGELIVVHNGFERLKELAPTWN